MPAIFEFQHHVRPEEIDRVGHVNNLHYLRWLQDAAVAHSAAQGWPSHAYFEHGHGWVARSHFIEYLAPAFVEDNIIVRTWIHDMKRITSMRRYFILRASDGKRLVKAETNLAFVHFSDHQLCRIPVEVSGSFDLMPNEEW